MPDEPDGDQVDDLEELDDLEEPDEQLVAAVTARLKAGPGEVLVEPVGADIPGLTVFAAHVGRRSVAGLWDGATVELDTETAVQRVADAWGYGRDRTVAAREVAAVIGTLEGNPGAAFLDGEAIELGGDPSRMHPPEEVDVDGSPGVRFWNSTMRLSPYVCTFLVHDDGRAEVRRG